MSVVDEDTELRDLLVQTLDKNGVLGKIKAELRASIFLALEAQDQVKNPSSFANAKLQAFISKSEGHTCIEVIHEFLDFFSLDYSSAVFSPETNTTSSSYKSSSYLSQKLNLNDDSSDGPVLASLLRERSSSSTKSNTPSNVQLERAQQLFSANLKQGSNHLVPAAAVQVLSSLCPKFPLFLVERYIMEENKSNMSGISLSSFMSMYEKLFYACHSVVSDTADYENTNHTEINNLSPTEEKTEDRFLKQTIGLSEKRVDPIRNSSTSSPDETPASPYGHFFDDDYYSKPKDSPVKLSEAKLMSTMKLPPLNDVAKPTSITIEPSEKVDWLSKEKSASPDFGDKRQTSYDDDFNSTSHASITEELQGESLLSSTQSSIGDLTDDRTISEGDIRADYLEEVKK